MGQRVGRLSIPSFLSLQQQQQQQEVGSRKRVPSYGSIQEAKKKLLQHADSVSAAVAPEPPHVFPTIPVQEAKGEVERRASLDQVPLCLTRGPPGVRFSSDEQEASGVTRGRRVASRRATEPLFSSSRLTRRESTSSRDSSREPSQAPAPAPAAEAAAVAAASAAAASASPGAGGEEASAGEDREEGEEEEKRGGGGEVGATRSRSLRPAPITRSYKKVTFTRDGAKVLETGRVVCQAGECARSLHLPLSLSHAPLPQVRTEA